MARPYSLVIPANPNFPLSFSPNSYPILPAAIRPLFHSRRYLPIRLNSHKLDRYPYPTSHTLRPLREECPQKSEPPSSPKKKKKKKPQPSFSDQTLARWSPRISSQRSNFPWQEARTVDAAESGKTRNGLNDLEFDGGAVNKRLGLIVEKLNGSLDHSSLDSSDEEEIISEGIGPLGSIRAPLVDGVREREELFDDLGNVEDEEKRKVPIVEKLNVSSYSAKDCVREIDELSNVLSNKENEEKREDLMVKKRNVSSSSTTNVKLVNSSYEKRHSSNVLSVRTEHNPVQNGSFKPIEEEHALVDGRCGISGVSLIVEELRSSLNQMGTDQGVRIYFSDSDEEQESNSGRNAANLMGTVSLPWERDGVSDAEQSRRRSNTELAEKSIPDPELRRLRNIAIRMKERMKVGAAGVTQAMVENIHEKWREVEVVKIKVEGPPSLNMRRTHEILERKTGGLVIWRSGSSLVLYRGMTYELPCVQSYSKLANTESNHINGAFTTDFTNATHGNIVNDTVAASKQLLSNSVASPVNLSEGFTDIYEIDDLLDQLGPRFKDWSGLNPLPVDADLLPGVVPGYKPPYRFLPYKTRRSLRDRQMTTLRRAARSMAPHFALGRNRQHQGLAKAMVKLWEKSAIAKIAIKRGVPNTCNERMAEEIKKLTGGTLVSRNKDYIVFYRGNDFLVPSIREVLVEKQNLATVKQDEEELARLKASEIVSNPKSTKSPLIAGTLAETVEAKTRWGNQTSHEDREKMRRELTLASQVSLIKYFERKLALAKAKVRKAEKALAKVQEFLRPAELPNDLETVTDEERFLYRKMGLKMRSFFLLGRREVFDGTIQNMHLAWKHRELVKILVKGKSFAQVKHIAISLEAESGGVLISLDKTTKGYAIIMYRGKNYYRPQMLRPKNLLTRRQALARSIELQRREALNHHIENLREKIQIMKSQLDQMVADEEVVTENLDLHIHKAFLSDDDMEDEGEEAYLLTYDGSEDDDDDASTVLHNEH